MGKQKASGSKQKAPGGKQKAITRAVRVHANAFFLKTLGRLLFASAILIGPLEYGLHIGTQEYPALSNAHYNFTSGFNDTPVPTFVPTNMCSLPPSQPYVFQIGLNGAKISAFAFILGGFPDNLGAEARWTKVWTFRVMTVYQLVLIPITMVATIAHFALSMGPFDSYWHAYECFGILWTLGPWWFNCFLFYMKAAFQDGGLDNTGNEQNPTAQSLLMDPIPTARDMEEKKQNSFVLSLMWTVLPYMAVWFPFVLTHLLPAFLIFLPQNLLVIAIFIALFWFIAYDSKGKRLSWQQMHDFVRGGKLFAPTMKDLEKAAGLHFLPLFACIAILSQILVLEATYYYAGDGWWNTMAEAWLERRSDYYWLAFKAKVLTHFYAAADLTNEAT